MDRKPLVNPINTANEDDIGLPVGIAVDRKIPRKMPGTIAWTPKFALYLFSQSSLTYRIYSNRDNLDICSSSFQDSRFSNIKTDSIVHVFDFVCFRQNGEFYRKKPKQSWKLCEFQVLIKVRITFQVFPVLILIVQWWILILNLLLFCLLPASECTKLGTVLRHM